MHMLFLVLCTLDSAYIGIGYTVFSAITSIFDPYFWSQNEVYIINYFGNTGISHLPAVLARTNVADVTGIECIIFAEPPAPGHAPGHAPVAPEPWIADVRFFAHQNRRHSGVQGRDACPNRRSEAFWRRQTVSLPPSPLLSQF